MPEIGFEEAIDVATRPIRLPQFHVVLLDDDYHTYEYVVEMLSQLFGYDQHTALDLAIVVDTAGRVIVDTTTRERAELKRDQIHNYGPDPRLDQCTGPMAAVIEEAND